MKTPPPQKSVGSLDLRTLLVFGVAAWLLVSTFGKFFSTDTFGDALRHLLEWEIDHGISRSWNNRLCGAVLADDVRVGAAS